MSAQRDYILHRDRRVTDRATGEALGSLVCLRKSNEDHRNAMGGWVAYQPGYDEGFCETYRTVEEAVDGLRRYRVTS